VIDVNKAKKTMLLLMNLSFFLKTKAKTIAPIKKLNPKKNNGGRLSRPSLLTVGVHPQKKQAARSARVPFDDSFTGSNPFEIKLYEHINYSTYYYNFL